MATCPDCGSIIMEGDSYFSHCGAHLVWSDDETRIPDYESRISQDEMESPDFLQTGGICLYWDMITSARNLGVNSKIPIVILKYGYRLFS